MYETAARLARALVCFALVTGPVWAVDITIVYTGETHAMVTPCKCAVSRDGGVARRATEVRRIGRGGLTPTLLVDAGGQFGGSAYDEYTLGPAVDQERTRAHLRACALMGYVAYAVGDEELQWGPDFLKESGSLGGAPFLSANMSDAAARKAGVERSTIVEVGGVKVGITAATPQDVYALADPRQAEWAEVGDPVAGVAAAVAELRPKVDLVLVLSHLGSDRTRALAEAVPGIDIAINAHYRRPGGLVDRAGKTLLLEFNLEARSLSRLDLKVSDANIDSYRAREIPLAPRVPDDPDAAPLVAGYTAQEDSIPGPRLVLDYYTAWGCGYCLEFDPKLAEALRLFGEDRVILRRWYVCHWNAEQQQFESTFGPQSIEEARRQIAIGRLHGPESLARYAELRAQQPSVAAAVVMGAIGYNTDQVNALAATDDIGRALLAHAERSARFQIKGTPTLYVNNLEYVGDMETPALLRTLCWALPDGLRGDRCAGVPECASARDCVKPGKIGNCVGTGSDAKCEYTDPTPLELTIVTTDSVRLSSPRPLVSSLADLLPGLTTRTVRLDTDEGRQLAKLGGVRWLPAFFFPSAELKQRPNLPEVQQALADLGEWFMVLPEHTSSGLDSTRTREPGRIDLFYRPYSPPALESVATVVGLAQRPQVAERFTLALHPMLYVSDDGKLTSEGGIAEIEEAARQAAVWRDHPARMLSYLTFRGQAGNSTYWDVPLKMAGLDPEEIRAAATSREVMDGLYADAVFRGELGVYGECMLLYENVEVAELADKDAALAVADRIGLAPASVTIIYTGSANGQLEACRCPGNPYGGLARQAGAVSELRDMYRNSVLVDTGDVLAEEPEQLKFQYQQRALGLMKYDAVAIGDQDFSLGPAVLTALAAASGTPYVSANVKLSGLDTGPRIIDRGGVKVGVVSLTSPSAFAFSQKGLPEGVTVDDPTEVARRLVPDLRSQCQVLLVLFHGNLEDARALAGAVVGIDVVICGHSGASLQVAERIGSTWLLAPGRNGEWVGRITLKVDETGHASGGDDQLIPMDDLIVDDDQVAKAIADYQTEAQRLQQAALAAAPPDPASGPQACAQCHVAQDEQWKTTRHATAARTLRDLDREFDPDCWSCHSSEALAAGAARMPDVSCVACHRVGPAGPNGHETAEKPTEATCLACHTEGKSPDFAMQTYWPRVTH